MKRRSYKPCHVFPYSFICPTHEAVKCAAQEQGGMSVVAEAYKKKKRIWFEFPKLQANDLPRRISSNTAQKKIKNILDTYFPNSWGKSEHTFMILL